MDTEETTVDTVAEVIDSETNEAVDLFMETLMKAVAIAAASAVTKIVVPIVVAKVTKSVQARRSRKMAEVNAVLVEVAEA